MAAAASPANSGAFGSLLGSLTPPSETSMLQGLYGNSPAVSAFAGMTNQANQANAQRGQSILQLLQGQGQGQLATNQQNFNNQIGGINQDMMSKGLFNTSIGNSLDQGAQNQLAINNENVNDRTATGVANMANSFTQQTPSIGILAQLMQQLSNKPQLNPSGTTGAISSSAGGMSHQLNDGTWQAMNVGTGMGI